MSAEIQKLYIAYFNRPADPGGLAYWTDQLAKGATMTTIANSFSASAEYQAIYAGKSNLVLIDQLYQNLFGRTADVGGLLFWSNEMLAGRVTITTVASALASGTTAGSADNIAINSKIAAASAFTAAIDTAPELLAYSGSAATAQASAWLSTVTTAATLATAIAPATLAAAVASSVASSTVSTGSTFTLTTGVDSVTGTSGNDTFTGFAGTGATSSGADSVNGGNGTDTFRLFTDGAVVLPGTFTGFETFLLNDTVHQATTIASGTLAGITNLTLQGGTSVDGAAMAVTVKAGDVVTLDTITDGDAADDTADTEGEIDLAAAVAVTSLSVTVKDVGATTSNLTDLDLDVSGTGVATLNLTATGTSNSISVLNTGTALTAININGAAPINIWATPTTATTINASTATGVVTVDGSGTSVRTITTGTANDVIIMGAGYIGGTSSTSNRDIINGGTGTDTLSITTAIAAAIAANQDNLTSIETVTISDASGAVDMRYFPTVTRLNLDAGKTAAATTITVLTGTTVNAKADLGNEGHTFTVLGTATTDTMTLIMDSGVDFLGTTGDDTFTGIETINIQTQSTIAGTVNIFADTFVMTATASTETVNISGKTAATFTGVVTADVINGSGLVGSSAILTLTAGTAGAAVITGGEAADVLLGSSSADIISGGGGDDLITTSGGTDTVTGGAGADIFYFASAAHVGNVVTDLTAGTGGDVIRIDDSGFGNLTGADTLAFKSVAAGLTAAATTDNVILVSTAVAGTSAAAVEDAVNLAGGGVANFSGTDVMYVIFNSTTGKAEMWNDLDGDTDDAGANVTLTATFDNIVTLAGLNLLVAANFNVVA